MPVQNGNCFVFCDNCSLFHFVYVRWRIQDLLHVENIVFHYYFITGCTVAATVNHSNCDGCNVTQVLDLWGWSTLKDSVCHEHQNIQVQCFPGTEGPVSGDGFLK